MVLFLLSFPLENEETDIPEINSLFDYKIGGLFTTLQSNPFIKMLSSQQNEGCAPGLLKCEAQEFPVE